MTSGRCVPPDVGSSQLTTICVPEPGDLFLRIWDRCPPSLCRHGSKVSQAKQGLSSCPRKSASLPLEVNSEMMSNLLTALETVSRTQ